MKNFLKGTAIAALVMFIIGMGLTVMGGVLGGGLMNISVEDGRLRFRNVLIGFDGIDFERSHTSEIIIDNNYDEPKSGTPSVSQDISNNNEHKITSEDITRLDFSLGAAEIFITPGDEFTFEATNADDYTVRVKNNELSIKLKSTRVFNFDIDEKVYITFPEGMEFNEIDIELGAGKLTAEDLYAKELDIEVGAGQFFGSGFVCTKKADISAGASQVKINGDFQGKTSLECGAGQITLELDEQPQDYGYSVEVGLGQAKLFDNSFNGIHDSKHNVGAIPFFDIEAGVGQIVVK